jgi:phenylacetic acid degradation operon negative regulatory protein
MNSALGTSRGRSVRLVPFLFGVAGREELSGPALLRLLGDLGLSPGAGRALIARLRGEGNLSATRRGRHVSYRLAGDLARGFHRLRSGPPAEVTWPGHFHALVYQVPEEERAFRDRLRRAAILKGFGILIPGMLISLHDRFHDLADVLREAPATARIHPARLQLAEPDAASAASAAWDLPALNEILRGHLARLAGAPVAAPPTGAAALRELNDLLGPVFVDMLRAPMLPTQLRPADWAMPDLRTEVARVSQALHPAVAAHVAAVLDPR